MSVLAISAGTLTIAGLLMALRAFAAAGRPSESRLWLSSAAALAAGGVLAFLAGFHVQGAAIAVTALISAAAWRRYRNSHPTRQEDNR